VINYLEKCCLGIKESQDQNQEAQIGKEGKWDIAIEFPDVIASAGRSKLHEVANYFGLAHHSVGNKKGKSRRTILYPKTLYIEK